MALHMTQAEFDAHQARLRAKAQNAQPAPVVPTTPGREPNDTEREYAERFLEPLRLAGKIKSYAYEADTLTLAVGCTYTPDWTVYLLDGGKDFHEVKGAKVWDDAIVKVRVAARLFPQHHFVLVRKLKSSWRLEDLPSTVST